MPSADELDANDGKKINTVTYGKRLKAKCINNFGTKQRINHKCSFYTLTSKVAL